MGIDEQRVYHGECTTLCFIPGLAARSSIFQEIKPSRGKYREIYLEWVDPFPDETLSHYAQRLTEGIDLRGCTLVAVSLGMMLAFEIAKRIEVDRIVLISTVKSPTEIPWKFRILRHRWLRAALPLHWIEQKRYWRVMAKFGICRARFERYNRHMGLNNPNYLRWCLDQFTFGKWSQPGVETVHIHGDRDAVFPIRLIRDCITVRGGTHAMVLEKPGEICALLECILLNEHINKTHEYKDD